MIPIEDFVDVTLAIEDTCGDEEDEETKLVSNWEESTTANLQFTAAAPC